MSRHLYTLLWYLAAPALVLRLLWRARRQPEYLQNLGERLGYYRQDGPAHAVWVHAVSVGETRAAQPLIRALLERDTRCHIVLTQMTPTGRATAIALWGQEARVHIAYLPYDTPACVTRFLRHFRPRVGILMETELWPNVLACAARQALPMCLINARLSPRSARAYARLGRFARGCFGALSMVGAQSEADAARLGALGAQPVVVTGNLKFEVQVPVAQRALGAEFRARYGERRVLLLASTREGEEAAFLAAFARHAQPQHLLVVVPRHPQRFEEVAQLLNKAGLRWQKRSHPGALATGTQVLLGDSMGEMFAYYGSADVAIIGGSWQPLGGQNLIEACALGVPVVVGPHSFNFAQVTEQALAAGAALRCSEADSAVQAALALIADPAQRGRMAAAAAAFAQAHRGALAASLALLEPYLAVRQEKAPD